MPIIDLCFRLQGKKIPADHGYALYAAISRFLPVVHTAGSATVATPLRLLGIHPINGQLIGDRWLAITPRSRLTFRIDTSLIREVLPLAGKELDLDGSKLRVGVPTSRALRPAATLRSRLVTFKHHLEPDSFLVRAQEELTKHNIKATPGLIKRSGTKSLEGHKEDTVGRSPFVRRTLRIHDKEVVGYAMMVQGLTADESLRLQEYGLGGRRRLGCGIFVPVR